MSNNSLRSSVRLQTAMLENEYKYGLPTSLINNNAILVSLTTSTSNIKKPMLLILHRYRAFLNINYNMYFNLKSSVTFF